MSIKFTAKAQESLNNAKEAAERLGHNYVGTEHLLLGLIAAKDSVASRALSNHGLREAEVEQRMAEMLSPSEDEKGSNLLEPVDYTPRAKRVIERSAIEANSLGAGYIGTEHLLLALLREQNHVAGQILASFSVDANRIVEELMSLLGEDKPAGGFGSFGVPFNNFGGGPIQPQQPKKVKRGSQTPVLDQFSRDFTQLAEE
ncbi:MAG: hypothetical protein LBM16_02815, partial [Clostridiales bacterium]|nr:hypothetical protein [Clostridiales bacterium]